jgi:hypothetical protein
MKSNETEEVYDLVGTLSIEGDFFDEVSAEVSVKGNGVSGKIVFLSKERVLVEMLRNRPGLIFDIDGLARKAGTSLEFQLSLNNCTIEDPESIPLSFSGFIS